MAGWRAVAALTRFELMREWLGIVMTLLFAVYGGVMCGMFLNDLYSEDEIPRTMYAFVDWMYLFTTPALGLLFNRAAWTIHREDSYTKRIAYWRSMPIPLGVILKARFVQGAVLLAVASSIFFLLQYGMASSLREHVAFGQWLANGFLWLCYAAAANALLIWMEMGFSGKMYMICYCGFAALTLIVPILLNMADFHLFERTIEAVLSGQSYWMLPALAAAIAAVIAGYKVILGVMKRRTYRF